MKQCAVCGAETNERAHEGVVADVCPQGCGLWLDEKELLEVVRTVGDGESIGNTYEEGRSLRVAADHDVEDGDEVRACPICSKPMGSVRYAFTTDVVVDVCARHGVWLDAGELGQLEEWAAARADPESPEAKAREERIRARLAGEAEVVTTRIGAAEWLGSLVRRRGR